MSSPAPPSCVAAGEKAAERLQESECDPEVDVSFRVPDCLARIYILVCASWRSQGFRRKVECEEGARSRF